MTSYGRWVEQRVAEGERVGRLVEANTERVCERLGERGFDATSVKTVLDASRTQLAEANEALLATRALDGAEQGALDASVEASDALERTLWHAQGRISEPFGPEILQMYGLDEPPPAGLRSLATYAHNVVTLLRAAPQTLEGRFDDHMETEDVARAIEEPLGALDDSLASLDVASAEQRRALDARDEANDAWIRTWRGAATTLEGLAALAGFGELAARAQPRFASTTNLDDGALDDLDLDEIEQSTNL